MMIATEVFAQFSQNRLNGEPVLPDLKILLPHRDELAERTGIRLEWVEDWAPWRNPSPLSEAQRGDPDLVANLQAIEEVCRFIAFVAAAENGQFFGYWRGPKQRRVANSSLVVFDQEGAFHLCASSCFAEAVLEREYGGKRFSKLRAWFRALGIPIGWENPSQLTCPFEKSPPKELHKALYERYRMQQSVPDEHLSP
jgi:hypothetical protein